MPTIRFTLNGLAQEVEVRTGESILEMLRDRCAVTSIKDGCRPQGQCGCCLVILDGKPATTCARPATRAQGKEVLTLEGLPDDERRLLGRSFVAAAGLQCGFCIPGIALRSWHLVRRNPSPSRAEIARALDGHMCRCTGYVKIIDAVELFAAARRGEASPEPVSNGKVGSSLARVDGLETALGRRPYVSDLRRPHMLHGAVLLSEHPRALVCRIDISQARALPGVAAVATARDVPGQRWYGLIHKDWPGFVAEGEEVRCAGDVIAAVAAEDEATAREAARLIAVEYEVREPVLDPERALQPGSPQVNPHHPNLLGQTKIARGNVEDALSRSAHVVSRTFTTQRIEHLFLEPECALAEPLEGGRMRLYTQGQGVFDDRRQVAAFLGMAEQDLRVELVPNGGAFGGKEDLSIQPHASLLARLTRRPVKLTLSREQSIRMHPKRHPMRLEYALGCDDQGRLTALRAKILGDSGAYASVGDKVLERAAGHAGGPYRIAAVSISARAACTNNPPSGAMRGFGAPQVHFALEGCLDLLAEKVGLDGWEIRRRNIVRLGDRVTTGQVLEKSVGIEKTLLAVKEEFYRARDAGLAVGIACGIKNSGIGNGAPEWGRARLVIERDGTVSLYNGYTEMGQGLFTILVQCAVEVTGLPAEIFRPRVDTSFEMDCGQTTASRATLLAGRAVKAAAEKLAADLKHAGSLEEIAGRIYSAGILIHDTTAPGDLAPGEPAPGHTEPRIKTHTSYGFATQLCILDAQGRLARMVAAHDVGRAINPALCEGQIEGSIHMGLGYALTEELECPGGIPSTVRLRKLGVLRARDMPETKVILVEEAEPEGPFGAKGLGEIGLVPTAAAVAGALAAHDGIHRTALPMKGSAAARAMSVGRTRVHGDGAAPCAQDGIS